jgi:hypothetical protein
MTRRNRRNRRASAGPAAPGHRRRRKPRTSGRGLDFVEIGLHQAQAHGRAGGSRRRVWRRGVHEQIRAGETQAARAERMAPVPAPRTRTASSAPKKSARVSSTAGWIAACRPRAPGPRRRWTRSRPPGKCRAIVSTRRNWVAMASSRPIAGNGTLFICLRSQERVGIALQHVVD